LNELSEYDITLSLFSPTSQNMMKEDQNQHKVYLDNAFTIKTKNNLAKRYFLPGYRMKELFRKKKQVKQVREKRALSQN